MAIDVTPGSPAAVAYVGAADADSYFAARGIASWTGAEAVKEQALIRGADYLERRYAGRWVGIKATDPQALAWPRGWVADLDGYPIDADEIPENLKRANSEAALLILTGTDLEPVLDRGGAPIRKRLKAGSVEIENEWNPGAPARKIITRIDGLLAGLVTGLNTVELLRV